MKFQVVVPLAVAFCTGLSASAHADLKWTETMTMDGGKMAAMPAAMGGGKMGITTNKWAKKDATRSETIMAIGPLQMTNNEISHCDTKEYILFDPDLKMYAPTTKEPGMMPAMPTMPGMPGRPPAPAKETGTETIEFALQDLGKETVAGIECQHYLIDMTVTATGCAGNGTSNMKIESWTAPFRMPSDCQQGDYKSGIGQAIRMTNQCDVVPEFKGDTSALSKAYGGFPMRTKMTTKDGGFTMEVTSLSQAELDDAPFAIPADWTKVTEADLQKAKQRNMMKKMMAGMGGDQ